MAADFNGPDDIPEIKNEPIDVLDQDIPKEFILASTSDLQESDCEDVSFFTQVEVDNTRKCLENTRLIIKDFETQLDWHLQQYMTLRNVFANKKGKGKGDETSKRQDLLSISQLSAIISNHPEGNKKFIRRKGPMPNGGRRKRVESESEEEEEEEEEESDFTEEDSEGEDFDDFDEENSESVDDPDKEQPKRKTRGRKAKDSGPQVKDEIEEEEHELIIPKEEKEDYGFGGLMGFDEDVMEYHSTPPQKSPAKAPAKTPAAKTPAAKTPAAKTPAAKTPAKTPAKRGRKPKAQEAEKTPAKRPRGRAKKATATVTTNEEESQDSIIEVKDEDMDHEELDEMLHDQLVTDVDKFDVDPDKPIFILKDDNYTGFDFDECMTSNVIITVEDNDILPEFVFSKNVANNVLNGMIKLVNVGVFDMFNEGKD